MILGDRIWGKSAYSKIVLNLSTRLLKDGHQVAHIPMGQALKGGKFNYYGVLVYPCGNSAFGEDVATQHYNDYRADMLITVKEPWVFSLIPSEALNFAPMAVIDHSPVSAGITAKLHTAFKVIAISRFGQRELRQREIESDYIPHGVDCNKYRRLTEEQRARCKEMFYFDPDEFVVGIIAMNRSRKMLPHQLRGYKRFRENNPDVKGHLMLWTDIRPHRRPEDADPGLGVADVGVDLLPEIMHLGLGEAIRWPERKLIHEGIPEWSGEDYEGGWDMVKLNNCFDASMLCSGGEGAGLTYIEAAACGVVPIGTDYAGAPEYVGPGLLVPQRDYVILNTPGTRYAVPDIDKMAEALAKVLNSDREKQARRMRRHAERYNWDRVYQRHFKPFIEKCEGDLYPLITKDGVKKWR